jgi:putative ABC transport system permease protein
VIVTSAFGTGDTVSYSIRSFAVAGLGAIDETVTASPRGRRSGPAYLPQADVDRVQAAVPARDVDGIVGVIGLPAPLQDLTSRQTKAQSSLLGVPPAYPAAFGPLTTVGGAAVTLDQLGPHEVYLAEITPHAVDAHAHDTIAVFVHNRPVSYAVRAVLRAEDGLAAGDQAGDVEVLMPLARLQTLLGRPGQITTVLVSNRGDALSGAALTSPVAAALRSLDGLQVNTVKQDALADADLTGSVFTSAFLVYGLFSIAAGVMLVFLIFVMLAAERRAEMGMARAIGTKRRHLIQQFLFEGYAYDLGAALLGVALGIAVGLSMVAIMAALLRSQAVDFPLQRHVEPRSIVVAFCLGALVTFLTVALSSWRVSRLDLVAAIRDLPDEVRLTGGIRAAFSRPLADLATAGRRLRRRRVAGALAALLAAPWHLITAFRVFISRGPLLLAAGALLLLWAVSIKQLFPFDVGLSLLLIGAAMLLRWILGGLRVADRVRNRLGFSLAGLSLVGLYLLPFDAFRSDLHFDIEMFFLSGMMLMLGGIWTVMYNVDLLLGGLLRVFGPITRWTPILKMAVTYPLQHRFRTGMTLFMFSLVIFALMVQAVFIGSFGSQALNLDQQYGGYDIYGSASPLNPIANLQAAIAATPNLRSRIEGAGGLGVLPVDARQPGYRASSWQPTVADVADDAYLSGNLFTLHSRAAGYASDAQVWQAVRTHPGYAVVDGDSVRSKSGGGASFQIQSFYYEDSAFKPALIEMRDQRTGKAISLTVIGVLDTRARAHGLYTAQSTLAVAGDAPVRPDTFFFRVAPGQDVHQVARALGAAFLPHGLDLTEARVEYSQGRQLSVGLNTLVEGFMALGLVVGIAALGVIATRSVVERRQQIGLLRALGFKRGMVRATFLMESGFIALLGTAIGGVLGLLLARQVILYFARTQSGLQVVVPWTVVALIVLAAYAASLLTTYLPAWQASRIYPAAALRYE